MALQVKPVFSFNLNHKIIEGKLSVGKFDGSHACLSSVTSADKIIIHNSHGRSGTSNTRVTWTDVHHDIASLTMSQPVTCLKVGKLIPTDDRDVLIVGSPTHVLAYHVDNNTDIFFKEFKEGVRAIEIGILGQNTDPVVIVGGANCIRAFTYEGQEIMWLVTSGNVNVIALCDFDKDGAYEIAVGYDNSIIQIFKSDKMLHEFNESGPVCCLVELGNQYIAYAIDNGTIGVYENRIRLWRIKSKNRPISIVKYDLLGTGDYQLITGWNNGKIDVRESMTGDVLHKISLAHPIAGITKADYRGVGRSDLICCTDIGEVIGYATSKVNLLPVSMLEQEQVKELLSAKQKLLLELQHYETNSKFNKDITKDDEHRLKLMSAPEELGLGIIPANTRLQIGISTNNDKKSCVEVVVTTNNSTIIRCVLIFAEGLFAGENFIVHPKEGASRIVVPLYPNDIVYDIHIKAFVGYVDSQQFHVFELTRQLPKFSMYALPREISGSPKSVAFITRLTANLQKADQNSYITFKITERIQRICMWINQSFLLPADIETDLSDTAFMLKLQLTALRNKKEVILDFSEDGTVTFSTEDIRLAGELVHSLAQYLNIEDLNTTAAFPNVVANISELFNKLNGLQETSVNLNADVSQKINSIKDFVILAEAERCFDEDKMIRCYNNAMNINDDLISNYTIRLGNFNEMHKILNIINEILMNAAMLRVGKYSTNMIKHYRDAVKTFNIEAVIKIIETGSN